MKLRLHSPRNRDPRLNLTYCFLVLFSAGVLSACGSPFNPLAQWEKTESANNLKQLGLAIKLYASDSEGRFPSLSPERGQLAMDPNQIYPKYLSDPRLCISPAHPDAAELASMDDPKAIMRDHSYWYLGYMLLTEKSGLAFVDHFRRQA